MFTHYFTMIIYIGLIREFPIVIFICSQNKGLGFDCHVWRAGARLPAALKHGLTFQLPERWGRAAG